MTGPRMPIETVPELKLKQLHQLSHLIRRICNVKLESHFGSAFYFIFNDRHTHRQQKFIPVLVCPFFMMESPVRHDIPMKNGIHSLLPSFLSGPLPDMKVSILKKGSAVFGKINVW